MYLLIFHTNKSVTVMKIFHKKIECNRGIDCFRVAIDVACPSVLDLLN